MVGQPVGPHVQLAEGQEVSGHHGEAIRGAVHLILEDRGQGLPFPPATGGLRRAGQVQPETQLVVGHRRMVAERSFRPRHDRVQERGQATGQTPGRLPPVTPGVVAHCEPEALSLAAARQREREAVEEGAARQAPDRLDLQAVDGQLPVARPGFEAEGKSAGSRLRSGNMVPTEVLLPLLSLLHRLPDLGDSFSERGLSAEAACDGQIAGQRADHPAQLLGVAARAQHADQGFVAAGAPLDHGLPGGEDQDLRRSAPGAGQAGQGSGGLAGEGNGHVPRSEGTRSGLAFLQGKRPGEPRVDVMHLPVLPPDGKPLLGVLAFQKAVLPLRHVRVLEGRLGLALVSGQLARIGRDELGGERLQGPRIRAHGGQREQHLVVPGAELHQRGTPGLALLEVERCAAQDAQERGELPRPVLRRQLAEVNLGEGDGSRIVDDLERSGQAGRDPEGGAQDLVPRHGRGEGAVQRAPVELSLQAQRQQGARGGALSLQPPGTELLRGRAKTLDRFRHEQISISSAARRAGSAACRDSWI